MMALSLRSSSTSGSVSRRKKSWECPYCGVEFPEDTKSIQCDTCSSWVCLPCSKVPAEMYELMNKLNDKKGPGMQGFKWVCRLDERSLPTLQDMNTTLSGIKESNDKRFDAIDTRINEVEGSIADKVQEEVSKFTEKLKADLSEELDKKFDQRLKEESEQRFREMNVVLFNVPTSTNTDGNAKKAHDIDTVISLFQAVVRDAPPEAPMIKNCFRLKNRRDGESAGDEGETQKFPVLKVTFVKKNELRAFVQNSRLIKENKSLSSELQKVMISRDLTLKQREDSKKLRKELVEKNREGEQKYTIRNGKIVPKNNTATEAGAVSSPSE